MLSPFLSVSNFQAFSRLFELSACELKALSRAGHFCGYIGDDPWYMVGHFRAVKVCNTSQNLSVFNFRRRIKRKGLSESWYKEL